MEQRNEEKAADAENRIDPDNADGYIRLFSGNAPKPVRRLLQLYHGKWAALLLAAVLPNGAATWN